MKIAISIIVGERHEELERCLESAEGMYDYISCTIVKHKGADIVDTYNIAHKYGAILNIYAPEWDEPFIDDFSAARNMSIDNIPADTDWVVCLDSDDIIINPTELREYLKSKDAGVVSLRIVSDAVFIQNRVWHHSLGIRWEGRVHEQLTIGDITPMYVPYVYIEHTRGSLPKSRTRNLSIGKDMIDRGIANSRDKFYYAEDMYYQNFDNELSKEMRSSLKYYREVIKDKSIAHYYRFSSILRIAEYSFFKATRDKTIYEKAIEYTLRAMAINPLWHDPYYLMGTMMFNIGQYDLASGWFNHCISIPTELSTWRVVDRHKSCMAMIQKISQLQAGVNNNI